MEVIDFNGTESINEECCLTIGTFDGLHLGHIQLLRELREFSSTESLKTMMVTFWPHPRRIIDGIENAPKILNTLEEKIARLSDSKLIDFMVIIAFDSEFSKMDYEEFVSEILLKKLHAKHIFVGYDHKFGKDRLGDFTKLQILAKKYSFGLSKIEEHTMNSLKYSSSEIRNALLNGDVKKASKILGYLYKIEGTVVKGKQLGRTIGFPTANLSPDEGDKLIPMDGVYAVFIQIGQKSYKGMMNIGFRPTVKGQHKTLEVNIFDFNQDIYSKNIVVIFLEKLRNECNFESVNSLMEQLDRDKTNALTIFSNNEN